jgi:hypothetical protein
MTISIVGAATGATTCTIPAHNIGDLILIYAAHTGANTVPTLPAGYTSIVNGSGNTDGWRLGAKIATATNDSSGTWTNSTALTCVVYTSDQIASGGAINIGGHASNTGATTTINYAALTMNYGDGASRVAGFAFSRSTTNGLNTHAPSGMTTITGADLVNTCEVNAFDTNGTVSGWSSTNTTVTTATGWATATVEIFETSYSAAITNLVQHRATSYNNVASVNEPLDNFIVNLPDPTKSGQGLVCAVAYPSGATPAITDDQGNTWPASGAAGTVTADAGAGAMALQIFRLASAAANTQAVKVSFGGSPQQPVKVWLEKTYNITGTVNGSKTGTNLNTIGTVSPGSFTPAGSSNLIFAYMVAQGTSNSTSPTDIAPARGYFLQDADIGWVSGNGIPNASQAFLQATPAATTPMFTLQNSGTDTYLVAAIALSVGTQGSDDDRTKGHIDRIIDYGSNTAATTWKNKIPSSGTTGLIIGFVAGTLTNNTVKSDNGTNTWTTAEGAAGSPYMNYFQGYTASSSRLATQTFTGSGNAQFSFYDLSNLDTGTSPVVAGVGATNANNVSSVASQPSLTPGSANGMAFGNLQNGLGPVNGITSPSGAVFDSPTYQTGQFTFTQSGVTANVSAVAWGQVYGDGITGVTGSGVSVGQSNQSATSATTGNRTFNISQTLGTTTGNTTSTDSSNINWGEGIAHVYTSSTSALNFTWSIANQPAVSVSSTAIWFKAQSQAQTPWGFDEQAYTAIRRKSQPLAARLAHEDPIWPFTAVITPSQFGFDWPPQFPERRKYQPYQFDEPPEQWPFTAVPTPGQFGWDNPERFSPRKKIVLRNPYTDELIFVPLTGTITPSQLSFVWDPQYPVRRRSQPYQPDDPGEAWPFTAVVTPTQFGWNIDPQFAQRHKYQPFQPDEPPEQWVFTATITPAQFGWNVDPQFAIRHRPQPFQPDEPPEQWPFTAVATPGQFGWDNPERFPVRRRPQPVFQSEDEQWPFTVTATPAQFGWYVADQVPPWHKAYRAPLDEAPIGPLNTVVPPPGAPNAIHGNIVTVTRWMMGR